MKRVWKVTCEHNGFRYFIFVETDEKSLHDFMDSEIPEALNYSGATDKEVTNAKSIGCPIYLYK